MKTDKTGKLLLAMAVILAGGCKKQAPSTRVVADGSSTVFPITEAMAEEFQKSHATRVTVGISGTGGGFKKFCAGETDMADASRPIKPSEVDLCARSGVEYVELPVAYDGLAVVVHPKNDWAHHVTALELKKLWQPEAQGKITRWSQVRDGWPDREIHLFGPGVDSGTYDYFTEAIVGKEHESRGDFTSSEDDNVLVQGVATDPLALGFFGFAYYGENKAKLKALPVDDGKPENGDGPVPPSPATIEGGTYQPLSRPIFIYVSKKSLERLEVATFIEFYLEHAPRLVHEVGYIPLPERAYALAKERVHARRTGSMFGGKGSQVGVSIEDLLSREAQRAR
ncbi:MAG: PstS family phosphate ABC transporter substrate-binding protein [Deltaproteobacteria bacterium]|nr:PstS family phosphate ABC transporter substrate-binding protein [Deltaproteobacteria bacterium]